MQQQLFFLLITLIMSLHAQAQQRPPKPAPLPDMNKLMKMTPQEREKYAAQLQKELGQQAVKMADEMNIAIDATVLPSFTLTAPVKDLKKLSTIPVTPPSRQQMLSQVSKMEIALKKATDIKVVQNIEQFEAGKSAKEIQRASVGGWYDNNPQAALLMNMKAVQKSPDDIASWNNLAAQYTMTGMQQHAVPILLNLLEQKPNSSILLNNMGQAFLGMGELTKATQYLQRCLKIDDLHPEANHSMAMIKTFIKDFEGAARHFEKEMMIAQRKSSLAHLKKNIEAKKLNLAALRKRKMQLDGTDKKNFFEEINLGIFRIPDLPQNAEAVNNWWVENGSFMKSLQSELFFWMNAGTATDAMRVEAGKRGGMYSSLVTLLLSELGDDFSAILGLIGEQEASHLEALGIDYYKRMGEVVCPQQPHDPLNSAALHAAYEKKCCDLKKPLTDAYISSYNNIITSRIQIVQARWKEYINGMISIVQLDPSIGNKKLVYATIANYFTFLITSAQGANFTPAPMECKLKSMSTDEADSIIAMSKRDYEIKCPEWLKINLSLGVAKLKADCEAYSVEADVYKILTVGMEKKFKTGTSTLYVGASVDGKFFKDVLNTEVSQQFYIVFDNNNQFSDLGMRGEGSFDIANGLFGEKLEYDFSMNSGFSSEYTQSSEWVEKFEKYLGYLPN